MMDEIVAGRHAPPAEMELAHDAFSVAYVLVRSHADAFAATSSDEAKSAAEALVRTMRRSLEIPALSREAAVGAGVTLAAAAGAGRTPEAHARALAEALFAFEPPPTSRAKQKREAVVTTSPGEETRSSPLSDDERGEPHPLACALDASSAAAFTPFGRLSVIRGALTAASAATLAADLSEGGGEGEGKGGGASGGGHDEEGDGGATRTREGVVNVAPWRLLTEGACPAICDAMERPEDSHFKFHAAAALRAATTRVKHAAAEASEGRGPRVFLPAELSRRVLRVLWANWDDPLSQTVKEVQAAFEQLLDAKALEEDFVFSRGGERAEGALQGRDDGEGIPTTTTRSSSRDAFLREAASRLLDASPSRKGRYAPLAAVVPRLGARAILAARPDLLEETIFAMRDDGVCTAAATLVSQLAAARLRELKEEDEERKKAKASDDFGTETQPRPSGARSATEEDASEEDTRALGKRAAARRTKRAAPGGRRPGKDEVTIEAASGPLDAWRSWWIPPLVAALRSPGREREGAGKYALPALLKQDGAAIVPLLRALGAGGERGTASDERGGSDSRGGSVALLDQGALVSVLRAARHAGLLDPDSVATVSRAISSAAGLSGEPFRVPRALLENAVKSGDPRRKCDALELACVDPKRPKSLPGALELELVRVALPTCLRGESAAFRNALGATLRALFVRIRGGGVKAAATLRNAAERAERRARLLREEGREEGASGGGLEGPGERPPSGEPSSQRRHLLLLDDDEKFVSRAEKAWAWTADLARWLAASTYPGAPYERKYTALDLLNAVAETWPIERQRSPPGGEEDEDQDDDQDDDRNDDEDVSYRNEDDSSDVSYRNEDDSSSSSSSSARLLVAAARRLRRRASALEASPYAPLTRAPATSALLGAVVDSWDKLRVSAFTLLARHPAPLAGVETREAWERRANQALALLRSPRVRESDAAALSLRLLFRKYARDGGWTVAYERGGTHGGRRGEDGRRGGDGRLVATPPEEGGGRKRAADEVSADALGTPIRRPRGPTRGFERDASSSFSPSPSGLVSSFFFSRDAIRFGFLFLSGAGGRSPETPGRRLFPASGDAASISSICASTVRGVASARRR